MRTRLGKIVGTIALASAITASAAANSDDLWGRTDSSGLEEAAGGNGEGPSGIAVGQFVIFRGVGKVVYAGKGPGGDLYLAPADELVSKYDWNTAVSACQTKGAGWSLATIEQMSFLYKQIGKISFDAIDLRVGNGSWYWTSTSTGEDQAMKIRFSDGFTKPSRYRYGGKTRCVRAY